MKLLLLSLLFVGLALAGEQTTTEQQEPTTDTPVLINRQLSIEEQVPNARQVETETLALTVPEDKAGLQNPAVLLAQLLTYLNGVYTTAIAAANTNVAALFNALGINPAVLGPGPVAVLGTIVGVFSVVNSIKITVLNLLHKALEMISFVLAIIGLAVLILYAIIKEGKLTELLGALTGDEEEDPMQTYSSYASSARALFDSPKIQRLAARVHEAITKYD
ncbi:uncharacterized protein [Procambarus clarkii]|uniref:uncharacterized protein n=1 Tax=Procambarus clarkii TaxID=6728 RepID=UPI001E677C90|nr:uncharacterized protein LOC123774480 [Procambarus clarkii]